MRILLYNWRDIKNPLAGGAEDYVHNLFSRLARVGHEVTMFTSKFPNSLEREVIDGVRVIRKSGIFSLYLLSVLFYLKNRKEFSVVVESINTIPFFTPLFVKRYRLSIFHHIAGMETYRLEVGWFLGLLLTVMQRFTLVLYRKEQIVTVSESTLSELMEHNINKNRITVIHSGVSPPFRVCNKKFEEPTIIYFGRIKKLKRVEELLYIFNFVQDKIKSSRLLIVGRSDEEYVNYLKSVVLHLNLTSRVSIIPEVNAEEKSYFLSKSWLYTITSVKEGWGTSVVEANLHGLPVIAYEVPGLKDSIRHGINGLLIENGNREAFSQAVIDLLSNDATRIRLSEGAKEWARQFDWDSATNKIINLLKGY